LFVSGKNITAEEIAAALKELVPKELQFLISDNGGQFTAQVFKAFASQVLLRCRGISRSSADERRLLRNHIR
jgi:hypothetical protein